MNRKEFLKRLEAILNLVPENVSFNTLINDYYRETLYYPFRECVEDYQSLDNLKIYVLFNYGEKTIAALQNRVKELEQENEKLLEDNIKLLENENKDAIERLAHDLYMD